MANKASEFVERFGLMWERLGSNRSVGRVLAWLMISDTPEQSASDIAAGLEISQANVSTSVRTLELLGLVERKLVPGSRRTHYRIPKGAWEKTARSRLAEFDGFLNAAALGREALAAKPADSRARIEEMWEWANWWRVRYGELVEEWEQRAADG